MELYQYPSKQAEDKINAIVSRGLGFTDQEYKNVLNIIEDVKTNKDDAIIKYTNQFDSPNLSVQNLKITDEEIDQALAQIDKAAQKTLELAASQIESFHKHQIEKSWFDTQRQGVFLGQIVNPVNAAGIYVPGSKGGKTPLVSSVLMGGIPAKIAGVKNIVMATPPMEDGHINPFLIAAAQKAGVDTIYKMGSAWAIAALTYGTQTIKPVDVIVGPGNIYVTLAKKIVSGTVGIDMIAGPSEILVIADDTANPEFIAADLLSQAEHDTMASSILVTTSKEIANLTIKALNEQIAKLNRKEIAQKSINNFGVALIVPDLDSAIKVANKLAPEHLELQIQDPFDHVGKIKNAGAVFMGKYTPEPVGDYIAGPNHILPTAGTARFSSALSVDNFIKKTSIIHYSQSAFNQQADDIIRLATIEGLDAHANSVKTRLK